VDRDQGFRHLESLRHELSTHRWSEITDLNHYRAKRLSAYHHRGRRLN
jgi:hypothetical protein